MSELHKAGVIVEENRPGFMQCKIVALDPRISIDDYDPAHPEVLWYCDNCEDCYPVTAQFRHAAEWVTLCRACLQNALNGIEYSLANPKTL